MSSRSKTRILFVLPCVLALTAGAAWATSPYDLPYAVQWSFLIGNSGADNPRSCTAGPDGTVWVTTMGAGGVPVKTWGSTGGYGGHYASGYGQISPTGMILQGNDICNIPGMANPGQVYYPSVVFNGNDPDPYIGWAGSASWSDSTVDTNSAATHLMSMKITSLAGSTPVDYDGNSGGMLPITNAAGLDPSQKWTQDYLNRHEDGGPYCSGIDYTVDSAGNYYVCGGAQWGSAGQALDSNSDLFTPGDYSGPAGTAYSPYVGFVSNDGTTLKGPAKQPEPPVRTYALDIDINETAGKVYVAGYGYGAGFSYFDADGSGPMAPVTFDDTTPGDDRGYAIVYDAATFTVQQLVTWHNSDSSNTGEDRIYDIAAMPDGGFVICGYTMGDMPGFTNPDATKATRDGYVERYDAAGNLVWNYQSETSYYEYFAEVVVDGDDIYLTGSEDTGSGRDPFVIKFADSNTPEWKTLIDNGGTNESSVDITATDKENIYVLSQHDTGSGTWDNTISYVPQGNNEVLLQKLSPGNFDGDNDVDFDDVQMAGSAITGGAGGAGVDTYDFDEDGDSDLTDVRYMITSVMDRVLGDVHPGSDFDTPGDVDNADLGKVAGAFTGSGGTGNTYFDGDMDFDGDVDNSDIGFVAGEFTGALASGGDPTIANLIYDPATGNVKIDASESAGGIIISFQLENDEGTFIPANYQGLTGGTFGMPTLYEDVSEFVIGDSDLAQIGFSGIHDFGNIFPAGMTLEDLEAYLTAAVYTGVAGSGQQQFDLVIPEPATMALLGFGGLALLRRRRK